MHLFCRTKFLVPLVMVVSSVAFGASKTNLDQSTNWKSCTECAGYRGAGSAATHSITRGVSSPSRDGASARFWLGGTNPYSNAYWWNPVATGSTASNFVYDLYFYMKNPGAAQALEFEMNQGLNGKKYIFGVQCGFKSRVWRVYDAVNWRWVATTIPCNLPTAYKWHHLVFEFHRSSSTGKSQFISISINGQKHYVNRGYGGRASALKTINVAFQMDGNKTQTDYHVWLDSVKASWW
ncbi:MAG: hypothetical protein L0Z53_26535 [Acidobacteriales bacterium]|nr:hypothetical protein [Terriglobales bacterium]